METTQLILIFVLFTYAVQVAYALLHPCLLKNLPNITGSSDTLHPRTCLSFLHQNDFPSFGLGQSAKVWGRLVTVSAWIFNLGHLGVWYRQAENEKMVSFPGMPTGDEIENR